MLTPTGIVIGLGTVVLVLLVWARRGRPSDLGTVSRTWIIENRVNHHDRD